MSTFSARTWKTVGPILKMFVYSALLVCAVIQPIKGATAQGNGQGKFNFNNPASNFLNTTINKITQNPISKVINPVVKPPVGTGTKNLNSALQKTGKLTHEQALQEAKELKQIDLTGKSDEELETLKPINDARKQDCSDLNQKSEGPKKAPTKAPTTTCSNGRCTVTQHNETQKGCTWQIDEKTGECVCKENSSSSSTSPGSNGGDCSNGSCGGDGGGGGGALGKLGGLGGMAGMLGGLAGMGGQNQGQGGAGQLTAEQLAAQQKEKDTYEKQIADLQKRVALAEEEAKAKEEAKTREEAKLAAAATAAAEEEAALGDEKVAQEVKGAQNPTVPETAIPIEIPSTTGSSTTSSQLESQLFAPIELRM